MSREEFLRRSLEAVAGKEHAKLRIHELVKQLGFEGQELETRTWP